MIGSICRMLEIQVRNPVVGKVFGHLASSAGCPGTNVASHGDIERISTDDVMNMGGWVRARLTGGIKALDSQRGAWEAEAGFHQRSKRNDRREDLHLCGGTDSSRASNSELRTWDSVKSRRTRSEKRLESPLCPLHILYL